MQLDMVKYRVGVLEYQRHTPAQKYRKSLVRVLDKFVGLEHRKCVEN